MGFAVLSFAVPFVSFEWHRLLSEMRWGIEDLGVWFVGEKRNAKFLWRSELVGTLFIRR